MHYWVLLQLLKRKLRLLGKIRRQKRETLDVVEEAEAVEEEEAAVDARLVAIVFKSKMKKESISVIILVKSMQ